MFKSYSERTVQRVQWLENACQEIFKVEASLAPDTELRRSFYKIRVDIAYKIDNLYSNDEHN